ncbi:TetR/AcrR family transcriptional regulator [Acinetobacter baumannii]|nr:TetR/AcrR family transcriptional regulator [Acinetobacter baumannii]MDC5008824.1 TetR/AcrR family transcriptional regulator [Acinetobacter baumannii]
MQISEKKADIIQVATNLFGQYGYHAIGVDLIIREAKVSKKTLYHHFPSKENLIIEVLKKRDRDCFISLNNLLSEENSPIEKLKLIFEWHDQWFNQETFTGCLFARAAGEFPNKDEEINKIAARQKEQLIFTVKKVLEQIVSEEKANTIAPIIIMLLDGATLSAQVVGNKDSAKHAWAIVQNLI